MLAVASSKWTLEPVQFNGGADPGTRRRSCIIAACPVQCIGQRDLEVSISPSAAIVLCGLARVGAPGKPRWNPPKTPTTRVRPLRSIARRIVLTTPAWEQPTKTMMPSSPTSTTRAWSSGTVSGCMHPSCTWISAFGVVMLDGGSSNSAIRGISPVGTIVGPTSRSRDGRRPAVRGLDRVGREALVVERGDLPRREPEVARLEGGGCDRDRDGGLARIQQPQQPAVVVGMAVADHDVVEAAEIDAEAPMRCARAPSPSFRVEQDAVRVVAPFDVGRGGR